MFRPRTMRFVTVYTLREGVPPLAMLLAGFGGFEPHAGRDPNPAAGASTGEYAEVLKRAQGRLDKITGHCAIDPLAASQDAPLVSFDDLAAVDSWLAEVWRWYSSKFERLRRLAEERRHLDQLTMTLINFLDLDIDLSRLQRTARRFVDVRVGTVPVQNIRRLEEALSLADYVLRTFLVTEGTAHVVVLGPADAQESIVRVLHDAGWRPIPIPDEFQGLPERMRRELVRRRNELTRTVESVQAELMAYGASIRQQLSQAALTLALATPHAELAPAVELHGGLAAVGGWVPAARVAALKGIVDARLEAPALITSRPPEAGDAVPSCVEHRGALASFGALVKNYGVPRYREVDPVPAFAFTYVLMFGMMYGDVGHGAVLVSAGMALKRRLGIYSGLVIAVGLASTGFGFLYGSLFGFEDVLPALWLRPLAQPNYMLTVAALSGAAFIVAATALSIGNRVAQRELGDAIFGGRGLAGLVLYLGLLFPGYRFLAGGRMSNAVLLAPAAALCVIVLHKWRTNDAPYGERALVVVIESFETVMAYVSGTLSFLRLAAFSLNHAALAVAVLTLALMMKQTGQWVTIVIGNLFSLVLECSVVAIQALRLEYYEGFSRFYHGDGREFRPLKLGSGHLRLEDA